MVTHICPSYRNCRITKRTTHTKATKLHVIQDNTKDCQILTMMMMIMIQLFWETQNTQSLIFDLSEAVAVHAAVSWCTVT